MFAKIAVSALIAGFGAGLIAAVLQYAFVQPLIQHAELFEIGPIPSLSDVTLPLGEFDVVRQAMNVVFSALTYTGYGFILLAAMAFAQERGQPITARVGIIWGVAGFVAMHLAPAFGTPPDMPGMNAADVSARQIWWYTTAGLSAAGLWLLAFGRNWAMWGAAIILLATPHIIGAPQPGLLTNTAPPELAADFAAKTLSTALIVWATLGFLLGAVWNSKMAEV